MVNEQAFGIFWDSAVRRTGAAQVAGEHCMRQAKLRILRCTALAFKHEPGGLRFVPGSRPWLPGHDDDLVCSTKGAIEWAKP